MSDINSNCHVSIKWDDSGGRNNISQSDAVTNANAVTVDAQELIDHNFVVNEKWSLKTNGNDNEILLTSNQSPTLDKRTFCEKENSIDVQMNENTPMKTSVTEVDDFDLLYDEISSHDNEKADEICQSNAISNGTSNTDDLLGLDFDEIEKKVENTVSTIQNCINLTNLPNDCDNVNINSNNLTTEAINNFSNTISNVTVDCNEARINADNFIIHDDIDSHSKFISISSQFQQTYSETSKADHRQMVTTNGLCYPPEDVLDECLTNSEFVAIGTESSLVNLDNIYLDKTGITNAINTNENEYSSRENQVNSYASSEMMAAFNDQQSLATEISRPVVKRQSHIIEECTYVIPNNVVKDVVSESVSEKKTIKKKKNSNEESVTTTKTKKTKKSKKYEEKENISVNNSSTHQNGIYDSNFHRIADDGDELSNVCVRDLKTIYCNEANKKTRNDYPHEEPIAPSISVKQTRSGFGKFDQLTKKTLVHVRSSDPAKVQQQFNQNESIQDNSSLCKACNKNVFAMEQIKAERQIWHKNCFRCKTCKKQLTVDIYSSHEGELYCKPHFRDLFKPKVVIEEEKPVKFRKPELIIRENQPVDLPPDVVRASDKPDLGLEELSSLNVKSRFQVFEKPQVEENTDKSPICVKRSPSILSKLARFQAKGMDVGVPNDLFNGIDYEESTSSEDENEESNENENITKNSVTKEKPIAFNKMNDVKKNWENGQAASKEQRREERREELQRIRSRLFMGKQNKMKEAYENAVAESERGSIKKDVEVRAEKARLIKEKFEKGEVVHSDESDAEEEKKSLVKNEDMEVFEAGISKKSRSIFQQMDAAIKTQTNGIGNTRTSSTPKKSATSANVKELTRQVSNDVVRASDPVEEVTVQTADISSKFKFFETYKAPEIKRKTFRITPPREGQQKTESPEKEIPQRNESGANEDNEVLKKSHTTTKMVSLFRQLEEAHDIVPDGPKPMKKFTPPPASSGTSSEEESEEESDISQASSSSADDDIVRASDKTEDEYLKLAQSAAKAKSLREKFEKWEPEKQSNNNAINLLETEQASLDTTKSLREKFESFKNEQPIDKPRPKVNRFVDKSQSGICDKCYKKVYPLEKVEAGDKTFHRSCFRCSRCNGVLRMETFTMNNGQLYCVPHFKQLFITKGNYDEGFGNNQHKNKWLNHSEGVLTVSNGLH